MAGTVIVTGASRGIGAAIARLAGARGYAVCVNYNRGQAPAQAVVEEIEDAGGKAIAVQADVSQETDVKRLFRTADQELGPLIALVNNAGISAEQARVDEMTAERIGRMLAVNLVGPFLCAREAVRRLSTRHDGPGGVIVNISSAAAKFGGAGDYVDYAASKGGLDTFTIGLANEVAAEGVRVAGVRPGVIETEIHEALGIPGRLESFRDGIPMKRIGRPEDIAEAVLWLMSDAASYVTGTTIEVTGGR